MVAPIVLGVGTDIVEAGRLRLAWEKRGERFLRRVFTEGELAYCRRFSNPWPHLAARFAAKESVIKALGFAMDPLEIEILRSGARSPRVVLHGSARSKARGRGICELKVSMSHAAGLAIAQALAIGSPPSASSP